MTSNLSDLKLPHLWCFEDPNVALYSENNVCLSTSQTLTQEAPQEEGPRQQNRKRCRDAHAAEASSASVLPLRILVRKNKPFF